MTRPTPAELARYRRDMPTLSMITAGIGAQLLAEIDFWMAEADRRERAAFEAGRADDGYDEGGAPIFTHATFDGYKAARAKEGEWAPPRNDSKS
jgi:hypothetical protein